MRSIAPILLALTLACGPIVMIPGGALSGDVKPAPTDWSFADDVDTVQLETNPADPYSVNVWGVGSGAVFYIAAGEKTNQWAENLRADSRARIRIGSDVFEVKAIETADDAELDAFLTAAQAKYDFEPDPEQRAKATLFRFEAR
jgi:hypothetical protein